MGGSGFYKVLCFSFFFSYIYLVILLLIYTNSIWSSVEIITIKDPTQIIRLIIYHGRTSLILPVFSSCIVIPSSDFCT